MFRITDRGIDAMRKPIILKTGQTVPSLKSTGEDFEHWMARSSGHSLDQFLVLDARVPDPYPDPSSVDAVIVTGSAHAVHDREPWSEQAGEWLVTAIQSHVPVLGICYGHQLIAHALGGESRLNPAGREIGVTRVQLLRDDPLFEGLPKDPLVIETHSDAVLRPPESAVHLAANERSTYQALAYGSHCRTVQWHPEFTDDIIRAYIRERADIIDSEFHPGYAETLLSEVQAAPSGPIIMQNFFRSFVSA